MMIEADRSSTASEKTTKALPLGKRHRRAFAAQDMMLLLLGLAHNTLIWTRGWLSPSYPDVQCLGILRLVRDVLQVTGFAAFDPDGRLVQVAFNSLDPLAPTLIEAWQSLLAPLDVVVILTEPRIVNVLSV